MTVTIAHQGTNYVHSEDNSVFDAWSGPFDVGTTYWLYWNFSLLTFERTFGVTTLEPVYQATAPSSPVNDQMWYDTANHIHYVYNAGSWIEVLRVFAAKIINGVTFVGMSSMGSAFAGTQISDTTSVLAGRVLFDESSNPMIRDDRTIFTTED